MNVKHGEENVQVNRMPMHTDEWIEFKWRILVWLEYF